MTLMDHVARYVSLKRRLGYDYRTHAGILRQYARFRVTARGAALAGPAECTGAAGATTATGATARRPKNRRRLTVAFASGPITPARPSGRGARRSP